MKKVKCIKDTIGFLCGHIYYSDEAESHISVIVNGTVYQYNWKLLPEYFQEEKEQYFPKWKIGDYVIINGTFTVIHTVRPEGIYHYALYNGQEEEDVRNPTPEELKKYFI